jgi:hypothetical protein
MAHLLGILILGTVKLAAGAAMIWIILQLLG